MKVFCPNCDALYEIKAVESNLIGIDVQCLKCTQEWYQYNFFKDVKIQSDDNFNLSKLAIEEYKISRNNLIETQDTTTFKNKDDLVKTRIQDTSDRLKETKQLVVETQSNKVTTKSGMNIWTIMGFCTITVILGIFYILYELNTQLQKEIPSTKEFLLVYKLFIDQLIDLIKHFFYTQKLRMLL